MIGTNAGPLESPDGQTAPATNRSVRFKDCLVIKFEKGQATEVREYFDNLWFMAQFGLAPQGRSPVFGVLMLFFRFENEAGTHAVLHKGLGQLTGDSVDSLPAGAVRRHD